LTRTCSDWGRFGKGARWRCARLAALAVCSCLGTAVLTPSIASADVPLSFAPAQAIDPGNSLHAVSCPSTSLCVISGAASQLLISGDPAASSYTTITLTSPGESLNGVSCPTAGFCVAVDGDGNAYVSSDPAAASAATWTQIADIDGNGAALSAVACPSAVLCVAVGFDGAFVSTTAGTAWSRVAATSMLHLAGVSCPTASLCVAVADGTAAITLSDLAAGAGAIVNRAPAADSRSADQFTGIGCASSTLCVGVDNMGYAAISTNPDATVGTWDPAIATGTGSSLGGVACPLTTLCVAVSGNGSAAFSSDPSDGAGATWSLDGGAFDAQSLDALACPQSGLCVAVDDGGGVSLGSGALLNVALAGAGGGTVTDSDSYIDCGLTCSAYYAAGSSVTLTALAGPDSTFAGWSGGGCDGTGTCTVSIGPPDSLAAVTATFNPPPAATTITKVTVNRSNHTARFKFTATNSPSGYECELVAPPSAKRKRRHRKPVTPTYHACLSPKTYRNLVRGKYTFYVYAVGPGGTDPTPASDVFRIA
jgi:hypothetical protein